MGWGQKALFLFVVGCEVQPVQLHPGRAQVKLGPPLFEEALTSCFLSLVLKLVPLRFFWADMASFKGFIYFFRNYREAMTPHKGLRYRGWDVISEVHQLVVFPPTYFRGEIGLVAYPRVKYLTPPLSVKIHLIFIIFQQFAYLKKLIKRHLGFAYHD